MAGKGCGGYPRDVTDEEWAFVLPHLLLCREDSPQRKYDLRTVFDAVRYASRQVAVSTKNKERRGNSENTPWENKDFRSRQYSHV